MNNRIRAVRDSLGLSREAFGKELGISAAMVNNIERGRVEIRGIVVKSVAQAFGVSEHWLLTGEGDMHDIDTGGPIREMAKHFNLSEDAIAFVEYFVTLPEPHRQAVIEFFKGYPKKPAHTRPLRPPVDDAEALRQLHEADEAYRQVAG